MLQVNSRQLEGLGTDCANDARSVPVATGQAPSPDISL